MKQCEQAITGQEAVTDKSTPRDALVRFYSAFNKRNFEHMEDNWLSTAEASMSNPLGGIRRGWSEIKEVYKKIFTGSAKVYVEFYDYSIHTSEFTFLAVGRERGSLVVDGKEMELAIRTTRIYTLHENQWKQIHHHGSMANPELLEKYQTTLLKY